MDIERIVANLPATQREIVVNSPGITYSKVQVSIFFMVKLSDAEFFFFFFFFFVTFR